MKVSSNSGIPRFIKARLEIELEIENLPLGGTHLMISDTSLLVVWSVAL
jgi:hypothetical protein